jgi:hypothetical protein
VFSNEWEREFYNWTDESAAGMCVILSTFRRIFWGVSIISVFIGVFDSTFMGVLDSEAYLCAFVSGVCGISV